MNVLKINEAPNGYLMVYRSCGSMTVTLVWWLRCGSGRITHELSRAPSLLIARARHIVFFFFSLYLDIAFFSLPDGAINRSLTQRRTHPGNIARLTFYQFKRETTLNIDDFGCSGVEYVYRTRKSGTQHTLQPCRVVSNDCMQCTLFWSRKVLWSIYFHFSIMTIGPVWVSYWYEIPHEI